MRKIAHILSPYSYQKAYMIKNSCFFGGIIATALVTAYVYDLIGSLWLRLVLAAAAAALIALLLMVFYKSGMKQLGKAPPPAKKTFLHACVCIVITLLLIMIVFTAFFFLLFAFSPSVDTYHTLTIYGTYILAVLLFPIVCLLLFQPAIHAGISIRERAPLFFAKIKGHYFYLLLLCALVVLINIATSFLINNAAVQTAVAFICSVILWTLSWGPLLQVYREDDIAAEQAAV